MASILLVENHPAVARAISELLSGAGHSITVAHSGTEAIQLWSGDRYQLLYTDYRLGDMTATTMLAHLQHDGRAPARVVMSSMGFDAGSLPVYRQRFRSIVPGAYLALVPKGTEGDELLVIIDEALVFKPEKEE